MNDRLGELESLVATLRGPDGCPWDREQTLGDLRAYLLEEAHEVAAAIDCGDWNALSTELGDLLFQIVFVAHLAAEDGVFDLSEVARGIERKMIDRHPHVFGDAELADAGAVRRAWEKRKVERRDRSLLADLPSSLPALLTAFRMTQKVAAVGFDWNCATSVLDKLEEETRELRRELEHTNSSRARQSEELGDLLFTIANLARHLGVDPDAALTGANSKFKRRFQIVEAKLAERDMKATDVDSAELERLWSEAKLELAAEP